MRDRDEGLGGGPQEYLQMMERVARRVAQEGSTYRPSTGSKGPQGYSGTNLLNRANVQRAGLVQFKYSSTILPTGILNPGSYENGQSGLYEGAVYRELVSQRMIGWKRFSDDSQAYSTTPQDGYSGRLPEPLKPVGGIPTADIAASVLK